MTTTTPIPIDPTRVVMADAHRSCDGRLLVERGARGTIVATGFPHGHVAVLFDPSPHHVEPEAFGHRCRAVPARATQCEAVHDWLREQPEGRR